MDELFSILRLLAGELMGDATFFFLGFHNHEEGVDNREEKRKQYYITKYSIVIVLLACAPVGIVKFILWVVPQIFTGVEAIWSQVLEVIGKLGRLGCIVVFMFSYKKIRKAWAEKFQERFVDPWGKTDPLGIYVRSERSGKYELSEKWIYIRDCLRFLMILNLILLAALHLCPKVSEMTASVAIISIPVLIPIMASTILIEFYNYISFDDPSYFKGRKNAGEKELTYDLALLKTAYDGRNIPGLAIPLEIKRNNCRIDEAMRDYIGKLDQDMDPVIKLFVDYLEKRRFSAKRHYHTSSLETTVRMIKGENLFCASPFYKDIDICIFFMAYLTAMKGKKVLVLAEDCGNLDELTQWLKLGVEDVQQLDDYYQVNVLDETRDDADIGVLSFQDIYRPEDFGRLKKFFHKVGFVVAIEASGMLAGGQEAITNLAEYMGNPLDECIWLLCDNNAESMLDLFSHLLNKSFTYVSATPSPAAEYLIGYWNVDEEQKQPWEPVKHYLGAELQAAEVAWRNEVEQVILYGEEMAPIYDMKWIAGQYYQQLYGRTGRKPHQYVMDDGSRMEISGNGSKMGEECFLIVEDCNFNCYEAARQYVTRASEKAVVHILSPDYMLRDFMKGKEDAVEADPKYIAQFVPEYVNTRRNVAVHLIRKMLFRPVSESEIRGKLEKSEGWEGSFQGLEDVRTLVQWIIPSECFSEENFLVSYQRRYDKDEGVNIQEKCYQLNNGSIKRQFVRYFQKACYIAEDGERRHINKLILAGHLDQKYLKGQLAVFNGLYYEIIKRQITDYEYILHVRRASEQMLGRKYYRQDRSYVLREVKDYSYRPMDCRVKNLLVSSYTANIVAKTNGYYECGKWNEIAGAAYIALSEDDIQARNYVAKQFLKVKVAIEDVEEARIAAVQMACLFQESFCTFYPQQYHLLSVAVEREEYLTEEEMVLKGVLADIKLEDQNDMEGGRTEEACFYIIEDSMEDMGLLRSIERNFERMQMLLSEYMQWNKEIGNKYLLFGRS